VRCAAITNTFYKNFQCNSFSGPANSSCMFSTQPACTLCSSGLIPAANNSPRGQCAQAACARPADTASTIFSTQCPSSILNGSLCLPVCALGYTANSSLTRYCNIVNLTASLGSCNPNPCNSPPALGSNSVANTCVGEPFPHGAVCSQACQPSFSQFGSLTYTCSLGILSLSISISLSRLK
jgi:hypothetical protein